MASRRTAIALFRTLLRAGRAVRLSEQGRVIFTPAITELKSLEVYSLRDAEAIKWKSYGLDGLVTSEVDKDQDSSPKATLTGEDIERLVRLYFKDSERQPLGEDLISQRLDMGFKAVSGLSHLSKQSARSSVHTTVKDSRVSVRIIVTAALHTQHRSTSEYNYHYRVQVENTGQSGVQLCGRHWEFRNDRGEKESVVPKYAQGVVGETPILPPGEGVQYMSQCFLSSSAGCMRGAFLFSDLDNEELFEAEIGRCKLLPY